MVTDDAKEFDLPLGIFSFVITKNNFSEIELNGLPKLPPSISCYARLHSLRGYRHPNLCSYIDVVRVKPERIFLVTECYGDLFSSIPSPITDANWINSRFLDCMKGLLFMENQNLIHSFLNPTHLVIDYNGNVKIAGYGIYNATDFGRSFDFPLVDPSYSAPEVFLTSPICLDYMFKKLPDPTLNIACDVWSIGLIFLQIIYGHVGKNPLSLEDCGDYGNANPLIAVRLLLEGLHQSQNGGVKTLPEFLNFKRSADEVNDGLRPLETICRNCLAFNALDRPRPIELIEKVIPTFATNSFLKPEIITCELPICPQPTSSTSPSTGGQFNMKRAVDFIRSRKDLAEVYHYWQLAGGSLKSVWKSTITQQSHLKQQWSSVIKGDEWVLPPSRRLPHYLSIANSTQGNALYSIRHWPSGSVTESLRFKSEITPLPGKRLLNRLSKVYPNVLYPLLITKYLLVELKHIHPGPITKQLFSGDERDIEKRIQAEQQQTTDIFPFDELSHFVTNADPDEVWLSQPISVREADIEYQVFRIGLFSRLLNAMPGTSKRLYLEARKDVPPFLRAKVWAALLGVYDRDSIRVDYVRALSSKSLPPTTFGKNSGTPPSGHPCFTGGSVCDKTEAATRAVNALLEEKVAIQITVDLPRCHSYDGLLASPIGQLKLRRVLVATLLMQPGVLEYTQGMDSIAAVFVRICYPDEALAFACLHTFLTHRLPSFFSPSGLTVALTSVFNMLLRLFAFHAPRLIAHLIDLDVPLVGLTTGWIYTLFSHALPLNRTELLWDFLIAAPPVFIIFVYISVFVQLDQQVKLETLNLESVCPVLSNFPDISIDQCRSDAIRWALATPVSLASGSGMPQYPKITVGSSCGQSDLAGNTFQYHLTGSFYQRLCTPNAWPDHLESEFIDHKATFQQERAQSPLMQNNILPVLTPADALLHLKRPDCFILDVRDRQDYLRSRVPGSVHRGPSELTMFTEIDSESDWEVVDGSNSNFSRAKFVASLMAEESWQRAVDARRRAHQLSESKRPNVNGDGRRTTLTVSQTLSPGLFIVLGYGVPITTASGISSNEVNHAVACDLTVKVANWLIRQDIDRVCVVHGGAPSVLHLIDSSPLL